MYIKSCVIINIVKGCGSFLKISKTSTLRYFTPLFKPETLVLIDRHALEHGEAGDDHEMAAPVKHYNPDMNKNWP